MVTPINKLESRNRRRLNVVFACLLLGFFWLPFSVIPNITKEIYRAVRNFNARALIKNDYDIALNSFCRLWKQ